MYFVFIILVNQSHADDFMKWPMDSVSSTILPGTYGKSGVAYGNPVTVANGLGSSFITLNGVDSWLDLSQSPLSSKPIMDIAKCHHGFTVSLDIYLIGNNDYDQYFATSGGSTSDTRGYFVRYVPPDTNLPFRRYINVGIVTDDRTWSVWFNLLEQQWVSIVFSWHRYIGLFVYVDQFLAGKDTTGQTNIPPSGRSSTGKLYIGKDITISNTPANISVDNVWIYEMALSRRNDILEGMCFFK